MTCTAVSFVTRSWFEIVSCPLGANSRSTRLCESREQAFDITRDITSDITSGSSSGGGFTTTMTYRSNRPSCGTSGRRVAPQHVPLERREAQRGRALVAEDARVGERLDPEVLKGLKRGSPRRTSSARIYIYISQIYMRYIYKYIDIYI